MNLSVSMPAMDAISRGLLEVPAFARKVLEETTTEAALLLQREWQDNLPRVSGLTAKSITSDVASTPAGVLGIVGSSQPSALFVELGTKPHMPPVAAMVPWVKAVLGITEPKEVKRVAFLVARKIAMHGTPAQRPMGKAVEATQGQIAAMFERAAGRIANRLAGGTA